MTNDYIDNSLAHSQLASEQRQEHTEPLKTSTPVSIPPETFDAMGLIMRAFESVLDRPCDVSILFLWMSGKSQEQIASLTNQSQANVSLRVSYMSKKSPLLKTIYETVWATERYETKNACRMLHQRGQRFSKKYHLTITPLDEAEKFTKICRWQGYTQAEVLNELVTRYNAAHGNIEEAVIKPVPQVDVRWVKSGNRRYSSEFKHMVVKEFLESRAPCYIIGKKYNVSTQLVRYWVKVWHRKQWRETPYKDRNKKRDEAK